MARTRSGRSGFEQRLLRNLKTARLTGTRLTIGFSGGSDSLALAAACRRVARPLHLELLLVHVDHGLRPNSAADAEGCRKLADSLGIPIEIVTLAPGLADRTQGLGLEEQGRRERYLAIAQVAANWGSNSVALAHQANDQAETVLLHLFRGTGSKGLGGMRLVDERPIPWWMPAEPELPTFRIIRPLLHEPKTAIERYLAESDLIPRFDESNLTDDFDRNWIRHQVIPRIETRWPAVIETVGRAAMSTRLDDDFLDRLTDESTKSIEIDDRTLRTDTLLALDPALGQRMIIRWLGNIGIRDITHDVVVRIYELISAEREDRSIEIGSGFSAVLSEKRLMTLDRLRAFTFQQIPVDYGSADRYWSITLDPPTNDETISIPVPESETVVVRPLRSGDHWYGTNRSVGEDLRIARIHPLLRNSIMALTTDQGILLIPAIYPTIRSDFSGIPTRKVKVQWRIANKTPHLDENTGESNES